MPDIPRDIPVISYKGLEKSSRMRMTEIIRDVSPHSIPGVLTGPNLAREIVAGQAAPVCWRLRRTTLPSHCSPL